MFCPQCGTENEEAARFCLKCGQPLKAPESRASPPTPLWLRWWVLTGLAVALLVGIVVVWVLWLGPSLRDDVPEVAGPVTPTAVEASVTSPLLSPSPSAEQAAISTSTPLPTVTQTAPATATPPPTATAVPTTTAPPTSSPPPSPTPTSTRLPSPTPAPTCALQADSKFLSVWQEEKDRLGCATNNLHQTWSAVEPFQRGRMYWREDADRIYVMGSSGKWQDFADIWNEGEPETVGLTPPPGLLEPKRGFGKIWREELGGPDAAIGWAVEEERGVNSEIQDFQRGVILAADGRLYVFFRDNGTWSQP